MFLLVLPLIEGHKATTLTYEIWISANISSFRDEIDLCFIELILCLWPLKVFLINFLEIVECNNILLEKQARETSGRQGTWFSYTQLGNYMMHLVKYLLGLMVFHRSWFSMLSLILFHRSRKLLMF
jgi:hypothetical protein